MLIKAKPKYSTGVDSNFVSKPAPNYTTAPTNQQDLIAPQTAERHWKFCTAPTIVHKFTHSIFDETNKVPDTYDPTGLTTNEFNTDRTLGATLRAEHYAAFRRPPPTYDKIIISSTTTTTVKTTLTLGATTREEHYQAFR